MYKMAISTDLIDNLTTSAINIVYYGFEISAGILLYLKDNYVTAIAGLVVLSLLFMLIAKVKGGSGSGLTGVKNMVKI